MTKSLTSCERKGIICAMMAFKRFAISVYKKLKLKLILSLGINILYTHINIFIYTAYRDFLLHHRELARIAATRR